LVFQGEIEHLLQEINKKLTIKGHSSIRLGIENKGWKKLPVTDAQGLFKMACSTRTSCARDAGEPS
jgi:hypothetical protein